MVNVGTDLRSSWELLSNLTMREVRGKYKRSFLGQAWSLLNPIATLTIYTLVFGFVLRARPDVGDPSGVDNFALWVACGLLPWGFFSNTVNGGMNALLGNANLVQKVYFPRWTLVASSMLAQLVTFAFELVVLTIAAALLGSQPWFWLPGVALFVVLLAAFGYGIGLMLSISNVYFRDTAQFVGIGMQVWFYATPIVYPINLIAEKAAQWQAAGRDFPAAVRLPTQPAGAIRHGIPEPLLRQPLAGLVDRRLLRGRQRGVAGVGRMGVQPVPGQDCGGTVTQPAVEVRGLSKRFRMYRERNQSLKAALMRGKRASYEQFWALQDVTFDIPQGSTYGLIGENGSGKSTLLKCIARILQPDKGNVSTHGRVAALLELGSGFHPELSGRENVFLNGSILGLRARNSTASSTRSSTSPASRHSSTSPSRTIRPACTCGSGFAIAIHVDPDILLVDEVLAVGDAAFQEKCMDKFSDFRRMGKTVVIVSHAMGSLRSMCDRAVWLEHGKVVKEGKATSIVDNYIDASHDSRLGSGDEPVTPIDPTVEPQARWGSGEATITEWTSSIGTDGTGTVTARAIR